MRPLHSTRAKGLTSASMRDSTQKGASSIQTKLFTVKANLASS